MSGEADVIIEWIHANCLPGAGGRPLAPDSPLLEEGGLDSLQVVQLVNFLEDEFAISVDVEELVPENFESVDHVVAMVRRIRGQGPGALPA